MKCHFNMAEAGHVVGTTCQNEGAVCADCACTGPCVHEENLVCSVHAGFIAGFIMAQPLSEDDEEGLDVVAAVADRFVIIRNL